MSERRNDPEPGREAEPSDLDTTNEPEPEWAEGIRRGRRKRAAQLRELLDEPAEGDLPP